MYMDIYYFHHQLRNNSLSQWKQSDHVEVLELQSWSKPD